MNNEITLLIDGNNTVHRTYWRANNASVPFVNSKGINAGNIFTFLKTVKSYVDQFNATKVFIAWDKKLIPGACNFRNTLMDGEYKATRDPNRNKEIYKDIDNIIRIIDLIGVGSVFPGHLEADDVISWMAVNLTGKKIIVSSDRDFIQLISPTVSFYNPTKKKITDINNFEETFNLTPKEYLYYKAIVGDKSDNIPGVDGYGEVKGVKLAKLFYSYFNNDQIPERDIEIVKKYQEAIAYNLKLIDLNYGISIYPDETKLYENQVNKISSYSSDFKKFKRVCEELEFNSIVSKLDSWQASFNKKASNELLTEYFKAFE